MKIYISDRGDFIYLSEFLDQRKITTTNYHFNYNDIDDILVDNKLIIIAQTSASIFVCIGTEKDINYGKIFLYGWDLGLIKIADNLDQFINSLIMQVS